MFPYFWKVALRLILPELDQIMRHATRRAFTLFHLLILLALLSLLFAMLLPAVIKAREAAARSQSQNNLRQIAIGCASYHDSFTVLPPGVDANHFSASARLLPFVEQAAIYQLIDFKLVQEDKANDTARKVIIKTYLNPLDPMRSVTMDAGATNYLFSAGSKADLTDNNGVFYLNSAIKFIDIKDGTSNTILCGETLKGDSMVRAVSVKRQHVKLKKEDLKDLRPDAGVKDFKDDKNIAADRCASWMDGRFLQGTFTATRTVDDEKPDVDCGGAGGLSGLRSLRNGCNVALCDGSVRFVSSSIDFKTWQALATRDGGEVIADF